uniref:Uncharacterized protein n=1 Tax=Tanacetum cinerariifolium TaxID=118510 RepID=A0A699GJH7_TANCI|nr:hypothetical protein [Tanacetum cinerariifolium]
MIDSQMDDMIKEKIALKEQVDSLEKNISKQIKEKECLLQTLTVFKSESKEKEDKYMENEIDLEKKIKELDNILFKVEAQRIKPTLYDGIVMFDKHVAMPVIDDEKTLILKEDSRPRMSKKEKDPETIKHNISHKPIDYEKLNRLTEDFGKRFTPQQELSFEQAFWLCMSNPTSKPFDLLLVKIKAPKELPKISLVNESLKKLKFHLAKFDNVVKIRTTPNARTEGKRGFKHTKAVFNNEIIPFLKSLKDIFNVFDRDLLNEIMEVLTVFDQMNAAVQQSSVDKHYLEIAKKELLLENDRLLQQIMSQDVLLTVMNSMSLIGDTANIDGNRKESRNLQAELLKSQNAFNDLLKSHSQLEIHSQLQDKDSNIYKLKDIIKSLREKSKEENISYDSGEIETKNMKLENSVAKLSSENERLCNEINHMKQEQADILRGIVEQAKATQPLDKELDFACKHAQRIQELLVYVQDTFPNTINLSEKKVDVTPKNKVKKVRFAEPLTSSSNIKQVESSKPTDSNTPVLSPTGLKCSTSNYESKPTCNKKNDRISQTTSRSMKNKVEAQPRNVNKKNHVVEPIRNVDVKHSLLKAKSEPICATKSKKSSPQPKAADTNQEKLYLLHMDLCGPMRMASINGKRSCSYNVNIFKASLFLWAEAINTAYYTQNHSLIRLRYNKTPYELMQDKKPDLSFVHVFGALCYPTNDNDDLGKLDTKADIGIFVGYAPAKKAFRIYNKRTRKIIETIHVTFDKPTTMASEKFSSGPRHQCITPATSSSGLVPNPVSQQPFPVAVAPRAVDLADSPVSTSIDQDAPSIKPKNFKQAMTEPSWIDAIQEEIYEFERLQVWELVSCPNKVFLIKLKWIYKVKTDEFGVILKNKAKLVAQGFGQEEGIDFEESFVPDNPSHVYKLKKALYGLKQAPRTCDSVDIAMVEKSKLDEDLQRKAVDATLYCGMIGSLMYLTSVDPTLFMLSAYVPAYADTDYAGCLDTRRSTSGCAQFLGDKLFSWSSKKQKSTAISSQRQNILPYLGVVLKSYGCIHN